MRENIINHSYKYKHTHRITRVDDNDIIQIRDVVIIAIMATIDHQ